MSAFYKSNEWAELRRAVLKRAGGRCEILGCAGPAVVVDHIISRRRGGADHPSNLRAICRSCDNHCKEDAAGNRRSDGKMVRGCFSDGTPRDPSHPWYRGDPDKR